MTVGWGCWGEPEDGRKALGVPPALWGAGAELPALAVESYPGLYLLPHPHPAMDFACAVPEAFPLTRSSCSGRSSDTTVEIPWSPGPPARALGSACGQRGIPGTGLVLPCLPSCKENSQALGNYSKGLTP